MVLPGRKAADPVSVYFLIPQTTFQEYPYGGHYKFDIKDGKVIEGRAFTRSCIALPLRKQGKAEALFLTHLLDDVPTEVHVFGVLNTGLPLFVGVKDGRIYSVSVSDGRPAIRLISKK